MVHKLDIIRRDYVCIGTEHNNAKCMRSGTEAVKSRLNEMWTLLRGTWLLIHIGQDDHIEM